MLTVSLCLASGCGGGRANWFSRSSSRQTLEIALNDRRPDERRKAVAALARSGAAKSDWAIKTFDTIARTDSDPMVRVEAVRSLVQSAAPRTTPTLVKLLNSHDVPQPDVKPPAPAAVRWEAAIQLEALSVHRKIADADRESALTALISRAAQDPDRNVRLTAITALRHYRDRRVLPVLIAALRTRDYALEHRAEQSLHVLTAQSHDRDADAWDRWLAATPNPFPAAAAPSNTPRPWWPRRMAL